ncbi:hypothetical protein L6164_037434 [Bauhinia variegata]|uniref:Uncharacterized protein n=1 Tax=Bauhinia variegata TaxID=167791 RepID=A0ACB9KK36_BAUVA|nr:hypothetical protein L6164_037434 [Bauhinia variegata]
MNLRSKKTCHQRLKVAKLLSSLEAGLGGARDATNVITNSGLVVSVIATVSGEHLATLGGSLETIAMTKSGIIKQGHPVSCWCWGGPFLPHVECIIRDKAASMVSLVVSASDIGNRFTIRTVSIHNGRPCQSCDIAIQVQKDLKLLRMIGYYQLQNAATAILLALYLRNLGWRILDESIRFGLEDTCLLGRSQFLTCRESELLGLAGSTILLYGGWFL